MTFGKHAFFTSLFEEKHWKKNCLLFYCFFFSSNGFRKQDLCE